MISEGGMTRAAFVRNLLLRFDEPDRREAVAIRAAEQIS